MTNEFTLDDLNVALEKKYGPFVFSAGGEKFVLRQVLRLPKNQRDIVKAQLETLDQKRDELSEDEMLAILKAVVSNVLEGYGADRLFDLLDNDLVKVTVLFEKWVERTQAGEA
jgi:hypothetical protein